MNQKNDIFMQNVKAEAALKIAEHNLSSHFYKDMLLSFYCPYCGGQRNKVSSYKTADSENFSIAICCDRAANFINDLKAHCKKLPSVLCELMAAMLPLIREEGLREWLDIFEGLKIQELGESHKERSFNAVYILMEHVSKNQEDDYADIFNEAHSLFKEAYKTNDMDQLSIAMKAIFNIKVKIMEKILA